jgi:hypothetical protein
MFTSLSFHNVHPHLITYFRFTDSFPNIKFIVGTRTPSQPRIVQLHVHTFFRIYNGSSVTRVDIAKHRRGFEPKSPDNSHLPTKTDLAHPSHPHSQPIPKLLVLTISNVRKLDILLMLPENPLLLRRRQLVPSLVLPHVVGSQRES